MEAAHLARCDACAKSYRVPHADRSYRCKSCGGVLTVQAGAEAQTAAAYRAALALGLPGSPQLRANIADQMLFHVRAGSGAGSARGASGGENAPGNLPDPVMIARVSAARGLT